MLRGLYIFFVYMSFLALGAANPFIFSLGYVWVDSFDPQEVAGMILSHIPVSLIMGVAAIGGYVVAERHKGRVTLLTVLLLLFALWVTFTTAAIAVAPESAWIKWNYAFKTLCFGAFVPFVFRTRVQIEAFLQIFLFSILVHFLPVGIKTIISGGGYGLTMGVFGGNSLLSEGSTLSGVALMLVPIMLYLRAHTLIMPKLLATSVLYISLVVIAIAAAIGTFERTGLVGMGVLAVGVWLRSRRKILYALLLAVAVVAVLSFTSDAWTARISTIKDYNTEGSALSRILVWQWTMNYVSTHPFGAGFNGYVIDHIVFPMAPDGTTLIRDGVAFHSIYFEVLGEQGYVGLFFFLSVIALSLVNLQRAAARAKRLEGQEWARDLAFALQVSLVTLLVCGSFIGIAFQPMLYYLFGIATCLWEHVRRIELAKMPQIEAPVLLPVEGSQAVLF